MSALVEYTPEILQFCKQPNLRDKLHELLEDPTMKIALAALGTLGLPREVPRHVAGVHHDTTVAHMFHRQLGVRTVLTMLQKMTEQPTTADLVDHEEEMFVSNLPEEYKAKPVKP